MTRIATALILIVAVVALVLFGQLWMVTVVACVVAGLAAWEYRAIAAGDSAPVPAWWMLGAVGLFFFTTYRYPLDTVTAVSAATLLLLGWNSFRTPPERVLAETAAGLLGLVYIAYPLTLVPRLWSAEHGPALLLFLFACVWSGDIAALYVGRAFGRHKLAPGLSPNKTWEGAAASVVGSVAAGMLLMGVGEWLLHSSLGFGRLHLAEPWWQLLPLAVLLNVAAQLGDLFESALKRGAGVKDSGGLLPGHGGVLDRIDALLTAAPVLWFVLTWYEFLTAGSF